MSESTSKEPHDHQFSEIDPDASVADDRLNFNDLKDVSMSISADLGKHRMKIREVLELERGSIVELDKLAGEMTDIFISGFPLARGEVVVIADELHVRIAEIAGGEVKETEDLRGEDG